MTAQGPLAGQQNPLGYPCKLLPVFFPGGRWAGWGWEAPRAGAQGTQFWASCFLYEMHDLEQVTSHPSPASGASSVKCQGWQICGRPGLPSTAVPLADIANQLLPSSPAEFFA